jgi:hypothetical protein
MQPRPDVGDTIKIGDLSVKVGSEEECEQCAVVVCGSLSFFPDDVRTTCSGCGATVFHRPYAPKMPPKVCITCMLAPPPHVKI